MTRPNLFSYAPRELSHSAFWAWVFSCAGERAPDLRAPRAVALEFMARMGMVLPQGSPEVETEASVPGSRARIDIRVDVGRQILLVENKVRADPRAEQLVRYREAHIGESSCFYAIISATFDEDVRDAIRDTGWRYFGADELLDLVRGRGEHSIIADYEAWLAELIEKRREAEANALSLDPKARNRALRTAAGQWALMKRLMDGFAGWPYRGTNRGGTPWTQFQFVAGAGDRDSLFYRIDFASGGAYLSLRQYQRHPTPDVHAKRERLRELRHLWTAACESAAPEIRRATPGNRGEKESEVGVILLDENDFDALVAAVPTIHRALLHHLEATGWPVVNSGDVRR